MPELRPRLLALFAAQKTIVREDFYRTFSIQDIFCIGRPSLPTGFESSFGCEGSCLIVDFVAEYFLTKPGLPFLPGTDITNDLPRLISLKTPSQRETYSGGRPTRFHMTVIFPGSIIWGFVTLRLYRGAVCQTDNVEFFHSGVIPLSRAYQSQVRRGSDS